MDKSVLENLENINRNLRAMHRQLPLVTENGSMLDLINHIESLVQVIQGELS